LENRKKIMSLKPEENISGYLKRYSKIVGSADKGAAFNKD